VSEDTPVYDAGPSLVDPWEPTGAQREATQRILMLADAVRTLADLLEAACLGSSASFRTLQQARSHLPDEIRKAIDDAISAAAYTVLPL
jgi:hypothetical protein